MKKLFALLLLLAGIFPLYAQGPRAVTGVVLDESGTPLVGVTVVEKGTSNVVVTNLEGQFSLPLQKEAILVFTFMGYKEQARTAAPGTALTVTLEEDRELLEEVVVIGYGTVKKSDLTGSVASFKKKDMGKEVNPSFSALLEGRVAGVRVTQSSAEPGGGIEVQIRGAGSVNAASDPLYVIDGLPIDMNTVVSGHGTTIPGVRTNRSPLSGINPADIESIEILKDASATAIYGARGANGVILVTTKKGSNGKAKVSYDGYAGVQLPKDMVQVLSAEDYKRILNEIQATPGSGVSATEIVEEIQDGGTDWQKEMLRSAWMQNHNVSLTGGNNGVKYYTSLNLFDQNGVLKNSSYQRYDGRVNLEYTGKKLKVGSNMTFSYTYDRTVPLGFSTNEEGSCLYAARSFDPTFRKMNEDGSYPVSSLLNVDNPLALLYGKTSRTHTYRTLGTAFAEYTILKGWTAKVNFGFDLRNSRRDAYVSQLTKDGRANSGVANIFTGTRGNYLGEFTTQYNKAWGQSSLNVMAGATYQYFSGMTFNGTARSFPVDNIMTNNMGMADASLYTMGSGKNNNKLLSYIGRVNYNYKDTYLFTATFRADGSSRFGENHKWGLFPSAAFAWKLFNYDAIKNLNVFDDLKFRLSYGRTGNQDIGNYMSLTTLGSGPALILDDAKQVTFDPVRLANPDLKWETTSQFNVGLDMGFFKNRLGVTAEFFTKITSDMLFDRPIASSTGYSSRLENVGTISNRGFELTLNSHNIDTKNFHWSTHFNLGTLRNRVENLDGIPDMLHTGAGQSTSQIALIREGVTLNSFYGYASDGIWQSQEEIDASGTQDAVKPGDVRYVDQNGDHVVNSEDRVVLGNSIPKVTFGLGNEFAYKNFSFSFFIDAALGFKMLNNTLVESYFPVSHRRNRIAELYLNRWTPENPSTKYPSFVNPVGQGMRAVSDRTVNDASYVRLQSVQFQYKVPMQNSKVLSELTFYVAGQNLLTLTKYSGQDPAFNSNGNSTLRIDFNAYPTYRTLTLGMNLSF